MAAAMDVDRAGGGERRPSEKELFLAAESGDAAAFASLAPADLSLRNEDGRSLLHVAAAAGHPQVVLALAQCGGDAAASVLNAKDEEGWAPIHSVASSGNSQIVDILLEREMRMLRWFCGHTRRDRVRNDDIRDRVGVAPIEKKLIQHRLRWFGHVQRRPPEAPVCAGVLKRAENVKSGRGRPKLTWDEAVKRDLKEWNISKDLAMDRSAWRLAINVPEP